MTNAFVEFTPVLWLALGISVFISEGSGIGPVFTSPTPSDHTSLLAVQVNAESKTNNKCGYHNRSPFDYIEGKYLLITLHTRGKYKACNQTRCKSNSHFHTSFSVSFASQENSSLRHKTIMFYILEIKTPCRNRKIYLSQYGL